MFESHRLFESQFNRNTWQGVVACLAVAFGLGLVIAVAHRIKNPSNKTFLTALVLLPIATQFFVMIFDKTVNPYAGIAVAGAFALIRFRSEPGSARDIVGIFIAVVAGFSVGLGFVYIALIFAFTASAISVGLKFIPIPQKWDKAGEEKRLKITVPEDMDYETEFSGILSEYTKSHTIVRVKTSALGSLYTVDYKILFKPKASQKEMIDRIRMLNGNLPIVCSIYQLPEEREL